MTRLRWLAVLLGVVIFIVGGFQAYWLRDNYRRAYRELETKTGLLFRETYRDMNDSLIKSRLKSLVFDSITVGDIKINTSLRVNNATTRVIDELTSKGRDSLRGRPSNMLLKFKRRDASSRAPTLRGQAVVSDTLLPQDIEAISFYKTTGDEPTGSDSLMLRGRNLRYNTTNQIVISLDSLMNDSVQLTELTRRFEQVLVRENMQVPFVIIDQGDKKEKRQFISTASTRGWMTIDRDAGPYRLRLGKVYPYLLRQLLLPILFSLFLVGLTLFSFVLMYRSLRRQQRLAQMKTDLVSNITHELKTPIATVAVAIEALKNFNAIDDPARTREYLDISQQELQRLGLLVDKVLKLSMFEKKEVEIQSQWFDLGELVDEVVASLRLQFEKYHAVISVEKQGDLNFFGDRLHLQSVVFNLLDNALKYSSGDAAIQLQLRQTNSGLMLKIIDNGVGIPPAYQQKVFEKFFRVPAGNTHNAKGHGLGLSYVARVVQQHGGSIHLESVPGSGSSFTINLPTGNNANAQI